MAKWFPQEPFELAINKNDVPTLLQQGYLAVPAHEQEQWLRRHFYIPAGFPGCAARTRIKSLGRVRRLCWRQLRPRAQESMKVGTAVAGKSQRKGQPGISRRRRVVLDTVLHTPANPIPQEWQWALAELLVTQTELTDNERMWFGLRPHVLPDDVAHACTERACRVAVGVYAVTEAGVVNDAHNALQRYHDGRMPLNAAKGRALTLLGGLTNRAVVELYTEAFDILPWRALHSVVGTVPGDVSTATLVAELSECVMQKMV